jgi:hypothetical protein
MAFALRRIGKTGTTLYARAYALTVLRKRTQTLKWIDGSLRCSFCGKAKSEVDKLVAGPGVYICNECVDLCNEIIVDQTPAR